MTTETQTLVREFTLPIHYLSDKHFTHGIPVEIRKEAIKKRMTASGTIPGKINATSFRHGRFGDVPEIIVTNINDDVSEATITLYNYSQLPDDFIKTGLAIGFGYVVGDEDGSDLVANAAYLKSILEDLWDSDKPELETDSPGMSTNLTFPQAIIAHNRHDYSVLNYINKDNEVVMVQWGNHKGHFGFFPVIRNDDGYIVISSETPIDLDAAMQCQWFLSKRPKVDEGVDSNAST